MTTEETFEETENTLPEPPVPVIAVSDALISSASFHRGLAVGYRSAVNDMLSIIGVVALLATVYAIRKQA